MRLNGQTDYSLRILMLLAAKEGQSATIQEISNRLGLSQAHMMRICAKLSSKGLVKATRGRSGGLVLGLDADEISLAQVVRSVEPDFALVECFKSSPSRCSIEPVCRLKNVLGSALNAFYTELGKVSLADLTKSNREDLIEIFRLAGPPSPTGR